MSDGPGVGINFDLVIHPSTHPTLPHRVHRTCTPPFNTAEAPHPSADFSTNVGVFERPPPVTIVLVCKHKLRHPCETHALCRSRPISDPSLPLRRDLSVLSIFGILMATTETLQQPLGNSQPSLQLPSPRHKLHHPLAHLLCDTSGYPLHSARLTQNARSRRSARPTTTILDMDEEARQLQGLLVRRWSRQPGELEATS